MADDSPLMKPMDLSDELQAIVGEESLPRGQVMKKVWEYIKSNDLQVEENKRQIKADDKLRPIFDGQDQISMFEMTKLVSQHMTDPEK
ncbi:MAG: SWIB/MDM2 domain-containing protein [Candidatus Magasanikbacteria bacterium]